MALIKVPNTMLQDAPISVLDYADLAVITNCRDPSDPASHLLTQFLNWTPALQAAFDAADAQGGGTVVIPKNTVPYYVQDGLVVKSNTTVVFEDWLILADYNFTGGMFATNGDNINVYNVMLDGSNIYAGGSGYNGIGVSGKNIKFYGGIVKQCAAGYDNNLNWPGAPVEPGDGGKGIQIEPGDAEAVTVDGVTFSECFMAMSSFRDFGDVEPYYGIVFNNITADNCNILLFVRQANGVSRTGLQHTVQLNNFYAVNCGATEGALQFSRASNVLVSNGVVVNDPGAVNTALIRGNHANSQFVNIGWYGTAGAAINLDPGTYCIDSSYPVENNVYELSVWGTVDFIANANVATPYPTLDNCSGRVTFTNAPVSAFFGYELRNGTSVFTVSHGTKHATITTNGSYLGTTLPENFSELPASNYSIPVFSGNLVRMTAIADTTASNVSLFVDSANGKLSYKDGSGTVHALY
jgi:hypothetical protein